MIIIVTGTPGTGKTKLAKALAKRIKSKYIDVNKIIDEHSLKESYDRNRQTYIVDEKKLGKVLISLIKNNKNLVIDSHLSHFIPKKHVDLCLVTKTDIKELKKRLEKRKYAKAKIRENLDAEIFDVCHIEAREEGYTPLVLNTPNIPIAQLVKKVENALRHHKR